MLPNIDSSVPSVSSTNGTPSVTRRSESHQLVQEAYKVMHTIQEQQLQADSPRVDSDVAKTTAPEKAQPAQPLKRTGTDRYDRSGAPRDTAEINFQLTREERDVFLNAMSGQEDPAEMTQEEQATLQRVAERIEKMMEEAETRETERLERLESAIKEWYNRLSGGKHKAPADLVRLIQQAAMGVADLSKLE